MLKHVTFGAVLAMLMMAVDESQAFAQESKSKKQLFADDGAVASSDGVTRVWTAARKANEGKPLRFWQRDQQGSRIPARFAGCE